MKVYKIGEYREKTIIADVDFKEIQLHETYDRSGQLIDPYNVGAVMTILTQDAADTANGTPTPTKEARIEIGDPIYCTNNRFYEVRNEMEEGVDYSLESETIIAYNYWNGNKWKTVILETANGCPDLEEVKGEAAEEILAAWENKMQLGDGPHGEMQSGFGMIGFVQTNDWYTAEVVELEEK
jgi:hypothetical protein